MIGKERLHCPGGACADAERALGIGGVGGVVDETFINLELVADLYPEIHRLPVRWAERVALGTRPAAGLERDARGGIMFDPGGGLRTGRVHRG